MNERALALNRRRFLECFSAGSLALMPGALLAVAQDAPRITREMFEAAEKIAGLSFTLQERESILARLNSGVGPLPGFDALRHAVITWDVLHFSGLINSAASDGPLGKQRQAHHYFTA